MTVIGFTLVPSDNIALRIAGAAIGGLSGFVSKTYLTASVEERQEREKEFIEEEKDIAHLDPYEDTLRGIDRNNHILKILSEGIVPLAMYAGFAAVHSTSAVHRCLGTAAGWVCGVIVQNLSAGKLFTKAKDRYAQEIANMREIPQPVLRAIDALREVQTPWIELTAADLSAIARENKVSRWNFDLFLSLAVAEIVCDVVSVEEPDLYRNLEGLVRFATNGDIPFQAVANGLAFAGLKISEQLTPCTDGTAFYTDDYAPETLSQAAKVMFLSEKLYSKRVGYFEGKLVPALAYFPKQLYKDRLTDHITLVFEEVCRAVFQAPQLYTEEFMPAYRDFLTVSPTLSRLQPIDMLSKIRDAALRELNASIPSDSAPMTATFKDYNKFRRGCELLGFSGRDFNRTVLWHTKPMFDEAARELVQRVVERPELAPELQLKMAERRESLQLDFESAFATVHALVKQHNDDFEERIDKVYEAADPGTQEAEAGRAIAAYAHVLVALQQLVAPLVLSGEVLPVPQLPFDLVTRSNILQAKAKMTGSTATATQFEAQMLDLEEDAGELVENTLTIPKVRAFVLESIRRSVFNSHAKAAYLTQLRECGVPRGDWEATALEIFHNEMTRVAQRPVPTQDEMDRMERVRDFLALREASARLVYLDKLGEKYSKAVRESMAAEGATALECAYGLKRLRDRLCLSFVDSMIIFSIEASKRMAPVVKGVIDVWKSETDPSYQRQHAHEAPKMFMREVMNMLDLHDQIYQLTDNGEEQGIAPDDARVTALDLATEEEMVDLYKHFLLHRISEADLDLRQRYIARSPALARFLRLSEVKQVEIRRSVAFSTYYRVLSSVLRTQDTVERQHIQQFAYLKEGLNLTDEEAEFIYFESTKKAVLDVARDLISVREKGGLLTADTARRIRLQVCLAALFASACLFVYLINISAFVRSHRWA